MEQENSNSYGVAHPNNDVFFTRLQELLEIAKTKQNYSLCRAHMNIIKSLRKYPLPIESCAEALILEGVGRHYSSIFDIKTRQLPNKEEDNQKDGNRYKKHKKKLIKAMKRFHETLLESCRRQPNEPETSSVNNEPERVQKLSIRLTPGTSTWSFIFCLFVCSSQFPSNEMTQADIIASINLISQYDSRCKIATFKKTANILTKAGLIVAIDKKRPSITITSEGKLLKTDYNGCSNRLSKRDQNTKYSLTDIGRVMGQSVIRQVDAPLVKICTTINETMTKDGTQFKSGSGDFRIENTNCDTMSLFERLQLRRQQCNVEGNYILHVDKPTVDKPTPQKGSVVPEFNDNSSLYDENNLQRLLEEKTLQEAGQNQPKDNGVERRSTKQKNNQSSNILLKISTNVPLGVQDENSTCRYSDINQTLQPPFFPKSNNRSDGDHELTFEMSQFLLSCLDIIESNEIPLECFSVHLLVDYRELTANSALKTIKISSDSLQSTLEEFLKYHHINYESANLPIGDFVWICRFTKPHHIVLSNTFRDLLDKISINNSKTSVGYEIQVDFVLPWIVERKTIADYTASIIDGRLDDQRFRLQRSPGIEHVIYLVEGHLAGFPTFCANKSRLHCSLKNQELALGGGIHASRLLGAIVSTEILSGFSVLFADGFAHTASLLKEVHKKIFKCVFSEQVEKLKLSEPKSLSIGGAFLRQLIASAPLRSFWESRSKKLATIGDIFGRQLRSVDGMGEKRVEFVLSKYSTPCALARALNKHIKDDDSMQLWGTEKCPVLPKTLTVLRELYAPDGLIERQILYQANDTMTKKTEKKKSTRNKKQDSLEAVKTTVAA